jgi:hypothetical protein
MHNAEQAKCCLCEGPLVHPDDPPGWKRWEVAMAASACWPALAARRPLIEH